VKNIQILSKDLINKIAAGEVVERLASIVKELLDNSIDAGSTKITVSIRQGGIELIEISDNGTGMNKKNAKLSLIQHATSKIASTEDLAKIFTLGFRGEALASISSIANLEIYTYDGTTEPLLVTQYNDSSKVTATKARSRGTTITVRNIFQNIPARRKFLRSANTEYKYILSTFLDTAIANPTIEFLLKKDGKTIYDLPFSTLKERIINIYPNYTQILPITYTSHEISISGYIGHPTLNRKDTSIQYIFLNGRPIKDRLINQAIKQGYQTNLMHGQHPIFFLNFDINPSLVDVNIHPRKREVKFFAPSKIFNAVKTTIESTLAKALQQEFKNKISDIQTSTKTSLTHQNEFTTIPKKKNIVSPNHNIQSYTDNNISSSLAFTKELLNNDISVNTNNVQKELSLSSDTQSITINKFIQIFNTYIIIEKDNTLLIIDQHAAAERINFERIKNNLINNITIKSQPLLLPISFNITPIEQIILLNHKQNIEKLGFKLSYSVKTKKLKILEVPILIKPSNIEELITSILHELEESNSTNSDIWNKVEDHIISTMACHGSIRAGQKLYKAEIEQLLSDLNACVIPYSCPHGRPLSWELTQKDLEKQFKRIL